MSAQAETNDNYQPDLDWSQIRETVLMLNLAVAHVETSLSDGDESVSNLAQSLTFVMSKLRVIESAAQDLEEGTIKSTILGNWSEVNKKVQTIIVAFQFYDKMSQRLGHLRYSLASLGQLIDDRDRLFNPYEWRGLQDLIKSRFTLEEDRRMMDAILNGASVEEALALAKTKSEGNEDEIELF